jgi:hypothetical protein
MIFFADNDDENNAKMKSTLKDSDDEDYNEMESSGSGELPTKIKN